MAANLVESVLTCASPQQAQDVIDRLFDKQLISRAEILPSSMENEVKVILENLADDLQQIKQEIKALVGDENRVQET